MGSKLASLLKVSSAQRQSETMSQYQPIPCWHQVGKMEEVQAVDVDGTREQALVPKDWMPAILETWKKDNRTNTMLDLSGMLL